MITKTQNAAVTALNLALVKVNSKIEYCRAESRRKYPLHFTHGNISRKHKFLKSISKVKVKIYKSELKADIKILVQDRKEIKAAIKLLDPIKRGGSKMYLKPVNSDGSAKKGSNWVKFSDIKFPEK